MTGTMYLLRVNPHSDDWYNVLIVFIDNIQMTGTMYLLCVNPHSDDCYNVLIMCNPTFRRLVQCTYSV
jgi:LmbE family N-acetylglucosaminyl deacetylase